MQSCKREQEKKSSVAHEKMVSHWFFARLRSHQYCALCGIKRPHGLTRVSKQLATSFFIHKKIWVAASARVCQEHLSKDGLSCVSLSPPSSFDLSLHAAIRPPLSDSFPQTRSVVSIPTIPASSCSVAENHLQNLSAAPFSVSDDHLQTLDFLTDSFLEKDEQMREVEDVNEEEEKELFFAQQEAAELRRELWTMRKGGTFSVHGLKGKDAHMTSIFGIPSYEEFCQLVDSLPFPPNLGSGTLDKYNQVAAGLLHLRTAASWIFLSFLFHNCSDKQYQLERQAIKALAYIEETWYHRSVFFPSPELIEDDTLLQLHADIPDCYAFVDGTYLYGESSSSASLHAEQYCHYKGDSQLSKFLVFCSPTGFIMGVYGPFSADSDAKLFTSLVSNARQKVSEKDADLFEQQKAASLVNWLDSLPPEVSIAFDSGFPSAAKCVPVRTVHPIAKRRDEPYVDCQTALLNRKITRHRGVIERVNRRLKIFKILSQRLTNASLINSQLFFHVAAILSNKYKSVLVKMGEGEKIKFDHYFSFILLLFSNI